MSTITVQTPEKQTTPETQGVEQLTQEMRALGVHVSNVKFMNLLLLKYIRGECNFTDPRTISCRGLILESGTFKPICVPPEKSQKFPFFIQSITDWLQVLIEEFIDGTMINVFHYEGEWHISTRSKIGAKCRWTSDMKFNEMFEEAKGDLDFNKLNPELTYSFVLRHPDNRIVTKYEKADLVLVQVRQQYLELDLLKIVEELKANGLDITIPKRYTHSSLDSVLAQISGMSFEEQGLVFKHHGARSKLRNEKYSYVKAMRGNNPKLFHTYLELRNNKMIKQFLGYFPEHSDQFMDWRDQIFRMTSLLHQCYVNYHIKHCIEKDTIPYELKPLLYELHGQHKTMKIKVTFEYAKQYFNSLPIKKIIFIINYQKNKEYHEGKRTQGGISGEELQRQLAEQQMVEGEEPMEVDSNGSNE
mgnify:FL=1